jgi:hypothetical protein
MYVENFRHGIVASSFMANQREYFIDRLRTLLTASVLVHHSAITYGAVGSWFYLERRQDALFSCTLLSLYTLTEQTYLMGFFFLVAGYFTPSSLERKGYLGFLRDRFLRLGLPLLASGLLLSHIATALAAQASGGSFSATLLQLWRQWNFADGPLWFARLLLYFSIFYCLWRAVSGGLNFISPIPRPVPGFFWWLVSAIGVGAAACLIRMRYSAFIIWHYVPVGFIASYAFLFGLGTICRRRNWFHLLNWRHVWPWLAITFVAWPLFPLAVLLETHSLAFDKVNFMGGFLKEGGNLKLIVTYAFWEPFVAWGVISSLILIARRWFNKPSALCEWLGRRAFAAFTLQAPVLVAIAVLMRSWGAPPLAKFGILSVLSCSACWLLADPLVRLPGFRRIF